MIELVIMIFLMYSGESQEQYYARIDREISDEVHYAKNLTKQFNYYKDDRTNLCFIVKDIKFNPIIANVPCTPAVEKLIIK